MKRSLLFILPLIALLLSFKQDFYPLYKNDAFENGEYLEFKASYGFLPVGKGTWKIHENTVEIHDRPNYQIDVYGWTSGFVGFVAPVKDHWKSYIDTASFITHLAQRDLVEGRYEKIDITEFQHKDSLIRVKDFDFEAKTFKEAKEYKTEKLTRGMISGFLYMRTLDFTKIHIGDTIKFDAFLDDTFYDFKVICHRREPVKTKAGTFKSVVFRPVMPDNSIFEGEDAILAWISDDENKIPLKVEAEMFIGHAGIELSSFEGLRNKPALIDD
jgi:hypothetical protein